MKRQPKLPKLEIGQTYEFLYPRHPFHGVLSTMERRRILLTEVRDLEKDPIDALAVQAQPLLRRGRIALVGTDLDRPEEHGISAIDDDGWFYLSVLRQLNRTELPAEWRAA